MHRSPWPRSRAVLLVAPLSLLAACGEAPPPRTPAVDIAPPLPAPSAVAPTPPPAPAGPTTDKPSAGRPTSLPGTAIRFAGGDGSSKESAIVVLGAKGENDGVAAEYQYLRMVLGAPGTWKMVKQALLTDGDRKLDALEVEVGGQRRTVYFDITDYFGKP